jgi:hypothetical protein
MNEKLKKYSRNDLGRGIALVAALALVCVLFFSSGTPDLRKARRVDALPPMYPDYTDVTIPCNIAPLHFALRDSALEVALRVDGQFLATNRGHCLTIPLSRWRKMMAAEAGDTLRVEVFARHDEGWRAYRPFTWIISKDSIDPYLTYRLIEPDYEVWNNLQIEQRSLTDFSVKELADYHLQDNRCMNCHIPQAAQASRSMLYVRGEGGGAILNENGRLRKLAITADSLVSGSVYFNFSPSGRWVVFSSNVIIPGFHTQPDRRLEVFDTKSDVYVADLQERVIHSYPQLADSTQLETFPVFAADGRGIYFCSAPRDSLRSNRLQGLKYALLHVGFDEATGELTSPVDTVYAGEKSVCHPRVSPDGRFLAFTVADYGTFPIWHPEADLWLLHLATGRIDELPQVNAPYSDTYHSWSSNSRWMVFASKRDDGLYGKPYFTHIDEEGRATKPFLLPQRYSEFYDNTLKSFNVPELVNGDIPFDAVDVERAMKREAETFKRINK